MLLAPITLSGIHTRLEPLSLDHVPALARAGLFPDLWRLQPASISTQADMYAYVTAALDEQQRGLSLPFAIVRQHDGEVIGSTRYMDIALPHRRLEIGATWLSPACQRSGANTEAKLLLLTHAFETLQLIRVVFKTEVLNDQSRRALARIGAVEEGIFRQHLIAASGRRRDMVYFSILDSEWPAVKTRLQARLR
ncbi:MAG: GNAT family protein [Polaromonas sp.]|nr:GNAT family protein [Polaromonas sp.]